MNQSDSQILNLTNSPSRFIVEAHQHESHSKATDDDSFVQVMHNNDHIETCPLVLKHGDISYFPVHLPLSGNSDAISIESADTDDNGATDVRFDFIEIDKDGYVAIVLSRKQNLSKQNRVQRDIRTTTCGHVSDDKRKYHLSNPKNRVRTHTDTTQRHPPGCLSKLLDEDWQSEEDSTYRVTMNHAILKLMKGGEEHISEERLNELPQKVKHMEHLLYLPASSLATYTDIMTLKSRLEKLRIGGIQEKDKECDKKESIQEPRSRNSHSYIKRPQRRKNLIKREPSHNHIRERQNMGKIVRKNSRKRESSQHRTRYRKNRGRIVINARKRLLHDFYRMQSEPPSGIFAAPADTNIMHWDGIIFGPTDSPWEGGIFRITLTFTEKYPIKAPNIRFLTKMFHPNISPSGEIWLTMLKSDWNPCYDVMAILISIQSILCNPLPGSGYNSEARTLFTENRMEYNRRVRETVEQNSNFE